MTKQRPWLAAALVLVGLGAGYRGRVRPWMYTWGATADDVVATLPGDGLVRAGLARTTRAISISASQELHVGDVVSLAHRYGDYGRQVVAAIEPKSHLVLVSKVDYDRIRAGERATGSWASTS